MDSTSPTIGSYASAHAPEFFPQGFFVQRHRPVVMPVSHTHGHVEVLLPADCTLTYETANGAHEAPAGRLSMLWGQMPHRVSAVTGVGEILIANLPLPELLSWSLPDSFLAELFAGALVVASNAEALDAGQFERWHVDYESGDPERLAIARMELQLRLRRQAVSGWNGAREAAGFRTAGRDKGAARVLAMIRFMVENYRNQIRVQDVAQAGDVSRSHAMALFQARVGTSIAQYLTELRLHHAATALADTDVNVTEVALEAGFGSLSRFYEVFTARTGRSPRAYRRHRHTLGVGPSESTLSD